MKKVSTSVGILSKEVEYNGIENFFAKLLADFNFRLITHWILNPDSFNAEVREKATFPAPIIAILFFFNQN